MKEKIIKYVQLVSSILGILAFFGLNLNFSQSSTLFLFPSTITETILSFGILIIALTALLKN